MTLNLEANFNIEFRSKLSLNLKSVLSNQKVIDIENKCLNSKSSYFKFREDFVILNLEANFIIKFRSKQFLI